MLIVLSLLLGLALILIKRSNSRSHPGVPKTREVTVDQAKIFASYGGSPSCAKCHEQQFKLWQSSHHGQAERLPDWELDREAFASTRTVKIGLDHVQPLAGSNRFWMAVDNAEGGTSTQEVKRIIGVSPLWQMLIARPGGRLQATEAAYHPQTKEWFDVYGTENRRAGEWGHWAGRGMNWNSMCAACHNTRLLKNYRETTDDYQTAMAETAVGCEACHGPMAEHNRWQAAHPGRKSDPSIHRLSRDQMFSVCGSCHSRRQEITGDFAPGDDFFDHYVLSIPDETETFYADGQIRDEDYEFTSFMGSRMHQAGVRCADCHEPHSSEIRLAGNNMCLSCHTLAGSPAPKIDAQTHSRHRAGTPGDQCVDCHMPQTTYMQRHGRHDHGFTVPDPLLTRELGIPNACGKCHADKSVEWAIEQRNSWPAYGHLEENRVRARKVAAARNAQLSPANELLAWLKTETNAFWSAVATGLLRPSIDETNVASALVAQLKSTNVLVRITAAHALEPAAESGNGLARAAVNQAEKDPVRAVRVEAAWTLRRSLSSDSKAQSDLLRMLRQNSDQPGGALQNAIFHLDRDDWPGALKWFEGGIQWDTNSAALREAFAVALSMHGEPERALAELKTACVLEPRNAEFRYKLALAFNEVGDKASARESLEKTVQLDPKLARAWYNLGLIYNGENQIDKALDALLRAESIESRVADIPYARATILLNAGRNGEARSAALRALEINPNYTLARQLLDSIEGQ
jgi:tetratricopeptide (TPR) repeat protein